MGRLASDMASGVGRAADGGERDALLTRLESAASGPLGATFMRELASHLGLGEDERLMLAEALVFES